MRTLLSQVLIHRRTIVYFCARTNLLRMRCQTLVESSHGLLISPSMQMDRAIVGLDSAAEGLNSNSFLIDQFGRAIFTCKNHLILEQLFDPRCRSPGIAAGTVFNETRRLHQFGDKRFSPVDRCRCEEQQCAKQNLFHIGSSTARGY